MPFHSHNFSFLLFVASTGRSLAKEPKAVKVAHSTKVAKKPATAVGITLKPALSKILETMGKLTAVNMIQPKRDFVQSLSGNAKTTEGFKKNCGILKKQGFLVYPSKDTMELTPKGIHVVGERDPSDVTNEKFHENLKEMIGVPQAILIFECLLVDGAVHSKDSVIDELGLDRQRLSGFEKNLSKLSTLGILIKTKTTLQLTDYCFPLGRD
eukprot:scaffold5771_cov171-Amphora_coffeaeformis.AAC.26